MNSQELKARVEELDELAKWAYLRRNEVTYWHDIAKYVTARVSELVNQLPKE